MNASTLRKLLETEDAALLQDLKERAHTEAVRVFGKRVWLRGLIEWSNVCRRDCLYCGIRASRSGVARYTLSKESILACCQNVWAAGVRTFVLQGGENPAAAEALVPVVADIHAAWPTATITLSLGELPFDLYKRFREAGAGRYLLRHETASPAHYRRLHPAGMELETRLECHRELRRLGFEVGMGMMVGSPFQTMEDLLADLRLLQDFRPEMVGIGPFIPQQNTPFADQPAGSAEMTLRLLSIVRLLLPEANLPSTTALSAVSTHSRLEGILAGANVIMPNFTPARERAAYALYQGKDAAHLEAGEKLDSLRAELSAHGYITC